MLVKMIVAGNQAQFETLLNDYLKTISEKAFHIQYAVKGNDFTAMIFVMDEKDKEDREWKKN